MLGSPTKQHRGQAEAKFFFTGDLRDVGASVYEETQL
jgi:hypothetical protein